MKLGIVSSPVQMIYNNIIVGLTHVLIAYMILSIAGSLQNIDPNLWRASRGLGATAVQTFLRVTLPLSVPGIITGSLIVFVLSASAFITPAMLGGGAAQVMGYLIWWQTLTLLNWPFASAVTFILILIVTGTVVIYSRWLERGRFAGVFQ